MQVKIYIYIYYPTKASDLNSLECETEKKDFKVFCLSSQIYYWQLDVLMIKNVEHKLECTPILKLMYFVFALSEKSEKSHQGKRQ